MSTARNTCQLCACIVVVSFCQWFELGEGSGENRRAKNKEKVESKPEDIKDHV